jgi:DNA primase
MIPKDFIDLLIQKVDVVDVISKHVDLKKAGSNYLGLCPFHNEKGASFTVSPQKNFYYCFGCGASGNSLNFLKNHLNLSYVESVHALAKIAGMHVPEEKPNVYSDTPITPALPKQDYTLLHQSTLKLTQFYEQQLKHSQTAIDYLKKRGLTGIIAKQFGMGYAPNTYQYPSTLDITTDILQQIGMLAQKDMHTYNRFRNRIMFPIRNTQGHIIAFGGRVLDANDTPKYLNSPETPLFNKSQTLYGLFESLAGIKSIKKALVVEGYMDVVALHQYGFNYAVATLGTACTVEHLQLLFRYTQHIVFAFDGDTAGENAALRVLERILPVLKDDRTVEFLFLPKQHDPDSYIRQFGVAAFEHLIQKSMPLSNFLLSVCTNGYRLDIAENRAKILLKAQTYLKHMPNIFLKKQIEQSIRNVTNTNSAKIAKYANNVQNTNKIQQQSYALKNYKRAMLQPIETLMQGIFIKPILMQLIQNELKTWIIYYQPDMQNFFLLCEQLNNLQNKQQNSQEDSINITEFWLNSTYANQYIRLSQIQCEYHISSDENFMEKMLKLAKIVAKMGMQKKQTELISQIETHQKQNTPQEKYMHLWLEAQNLNSLLKN